jgi:tetratricopeptide (TPR) repeat protein
MRIAAILAVLIVVGFPVASDAAWTRLLTEHFTFVGDASERATREVAQRMEHFATVLKALMPNAGDGTPVPTVVVVFADDKSFTPFKPRYQGKPLEMIAGYFQPGEASNYITMMLAQEDYALRTAFHEYTHAVTANTLSNAPMWLMEGLAQFYEMTADRGGGRRALIGVVPPEHVATLRQQQFMPIDALMAVDHASPAYNERERRGLFYAESWAVVHYLTLGNRARGGQIARYLTLLASGTPPTESFQQAFQTDPKTLEREVRDYVGQFAFPAVDVPVGDKDERAVGRAERLQDWEAQSYLGDLLAHMSDRADDARAYLERLTAAHPDSARAVSALGGLYIRQGKADEGLALLERAAAAAPDDALVQTLLARALVDRLSADVSGDREAASAKVQAVLARALELDGRSANLNALAGYVELFRDTDLARAQALLLQAIRLAPAREDYRFVLVDIYTRQREFDRATDVLGTLVAQGSTREIRDRARSKLGGISALRNASSIPPPAVGAPPPGVPDALSRADSPRASDPGGRFVPELRLPAADESRAVGFFKSVECAAGTVTLILDTTAGPLRLTAPTFDQIEFISYRADAPKMVKCGSIEPAQRVLATFRGARADTAGHGEAVAIELLPIGFEPKLNP